jgi:hypothetical protein
MASHGVSWTLGAHMRFGSLDFFITTEGELARAPTPIQPLRSAGLDTVVKALEELRLHSPKASSSTSITSGWNASSPSSLDPDRPRRIYAACLSHLPTS